MKYIVLFVSLFALSGCATQTFNMDGGSATTPTSEIRNSFFVSGIGQSKQVDAAAICGGAENISKVETEMAFIDALLGSVTFGIYTPLTARVYCKG